jgi:hypothetical protein
MSSVTIIVQISSERSFRAHQSDPLPPDTACMCCEDLNGWRFWGGGDFVTFFFQDGAMEVKS